MLDELLGRGLSSKCKPLIKVINSRLDTIRRKRNCTLRLLRTDVEGLLTSGQEMKAFDRAEVLIAEQNRSTAYDMVEQFCASILSNLPALQKQRECPPESMEAVASLMFAAARFADLPELRNLRGIFSERYGIAPTNNAADLYTFPGCAVNKEFAEIFSSKPPSTDRKLKLMREISKESSIKWDSKAFEERVTNPHASTNVAVGTQLPQLNDGQRHVDDVGHEKVNQDQLPHRKTGIPEYAREKNAGHDPLHAEVRQGILSHRKNEQPMEHSSKTAPLYDDTIDENDKRLHPKRNSRKSEPSLHHLKEPDCVLDDTLNGNNGCKEHTRKNELSQGHAIKSDRQGGDMLDESFESDVLSHGRCKEHSDYETQEMWNVAADKKVKKTLSNKREPTLDNLTDEAYERDERERLSHRSKLPYRDTKTTEKTHEGSFKGNAHESLPHSPMVEHQENLSQRSKPSFFNDKTATNMQETKDYATAEYESEYGLGDRQEKLVHRPPYSYKTTEKMRYKGNGHESRDQDNQFHRSKSTYGRDLVAAGMHEDAKYRGDDPSTFSPRSPLGDDQQTMPHKSKPPYAYNRTPEMVHEDTFHEVYDHESKSHHGRQSQFDNDQEKRHPPHGNRIAKIYVDAYYDENEQEILPQGNQSPYYDQKKVRRRTNPPYGYTGTLRLHDDAPYNQNNHETLSDRTQSPLGDKKEKLSRRSKSTRPYTRATDNISNDVSCTVTDYETLDESRSPFECRRTKEKTGDGTILRKGKHNTLAQKSEASVEHLAELDEVDNGQVPGGIDVHLRTKGREESDNLKSRFKNVKPPYVILTGQQVSYSEDADGCNDHQDADYPPALNTKGEQKDMKPNHNRTIRPPPYVVSTKEGRSKNGAEDRRADAKYEQDDEFLAEEDDSAYRHPRTLLDRSIHHEKQGGRVNRFEQHREVIAEHDTAHRDKFPKPASVRQRHPQAYVNSDVDGNYPPHRMKHDKHKSTRMVLDHGDDDVPEAGYSLSRHKYREETSHGVDTHPVDDKPRRDTHPVDDKPRRHHRRPVQHHLNEEDDEDKIMDELLLHYSQKVTRVENDIQVGSKPPTRPIAGFSGHTSATRSASRAGSDPRSESSHAPNRAASLPPEQWQPEEEVKLHVRATSMQPDMYNGHVHPKLPDYDDLAERFAALRRQSNG